MTTTQTQQTETIQHRIQELLDNKKVDMTTIAKGINKSPATLSQYMQNKYNGRVDILEQDLQSYLKTFEKKEAAQIRSLKYVDTDISRKIFNAANMCHIHGKMGVCYGSPGIGKTTAIQEYQKANSGVIIVDPFEGTSSREVLRQIADQLKVSYSKIMPLDEFTKNVIKKLENNKYLIILDESENLKIDVFKIIRKIHDRTKSSCGVLFVGTQELETLLNKVQSGFPYISSRIGYVEKLDLLRTTDAEKLITQYFPNCSKDLLMLIAKYCKFNARNIQNLLDLCVDIMQSNNVQLDIDVVQAAREKLLI